ncbi:MAG: ParA family protein [Salinibacter sp.]|uniref:ParA family protein n=1 Tax=Salinibacter sp. TaxID=2065818 RepID=UPI002FC31F1C
MYTIAVINQKGGVGKTVTTVNLASALQHKGHDPLVIDYDPQMNATDWLMGREATEDDATIFDSLATWDGEKSDAWTFTDVLRTSESVGVDFIPSDRRMAAASFDSVIGRSPVFPQQFRCRIQEFRTAQVQRNSSSPKKHDYCLIDCPPSLGRSIATALAGADGIIVPIHADRFSMRGVSQLQDTIKQIRKVHNDSLRILGLLPNDLDLRSGLVSDMQEKFENVYSDVLFDTAIPWRSKINEVATYSKNIMEYDGASDAASYYLALADEVVERSRVATAA